MSDSAGDLPPLADLLRWLAEMPPDFRATPDALEAGRPRVRAIVADLFETMYGTLPEPKFLGAFDLVRGEKADPNRLQLVLMALHVLWHPAFREHPPVRLSLQHFLKDELPSVAAIVPVEKIAREEERAEELIRRIVRVSGGRLFGESKNEADDRFKQVDSVERQRVLAQAAEREKRARAVREAMAKKAAEEAAAKVGRE